MNVGNAQTTDHRAAIREFIEDEVLFGQSDAIDDGTSLTGSGVLDSTGVMEVISFLEATFSVQFDDQELVADNFDSIDRIATFLASKLS